MMMMMIGRQTCKRVGRRGGVAKWIGNDPVRVKVRKHLRSEGVDDLRHLGRELVAPLSEPHERVGRGRLEREHQGPQRLEDVHADFAEPERGKSDGGKDDDFGNDKEPQGHPRRYHAPDAISVHQKREADPVEAVQKWCEEQRHQQLPRRHDVPPLDLHRRGRQCLARFLDRDDFSRHEDRREQSQPRQCADGEHHEFPQPVQEREDDFRDREFGILHLMVSQIEQSQLLVVIIHRFLKVLDSRIVFVKRIPFDQPSIQFHHHWQRKLLSRRLVQSSCGLDQLDKATHISGMIEMTEGREHVPSRYRSRDSSLSLLPTLDIPSPRAE